ncbi:alpha/beta hydrolase [Mesorhizobium tianshanense]|nr:alpha/beta hydrolase [Mesorhizobium tianshanense]
MQVSKPRYAMSEDGTKIAFWSNGNGPVIIMVVGAFNDHNTGADLAAELTRSYTVVTYDRRGRGASGDAPTYSTDREVEDLTAILEAVGGDADVLGFSSGASLVLMAAAEGIPLSKLILVEAPWMISEARPRPDLDLEASLRELVAKGQPGEAVELFQRDYIGMPEGVIAQMRNAPFRPFMESMAQTLSYEAAIMRDLTLPEGLAVKVDQPVLLLYGEKSPSWMGETAAKIAGELSHGRHAEVAGIGHDLTVDILPHIEGFLEAN